MHIASTTSIPANTVTSQHHQQPPAQAARDLLESRANLANEPFGELVSLFARGQDVPPSVDRSKYTSPSASDTTNSNTEDA
jgi:hypothetical protein